LALGCTAMKLSMSRRLRAAENPELSSEMKNRRARQNVPHAERFAPGGRESAGANSAAEVTARFDAGWNFTYGA
jgi:hypothetical protein